MDRGTWVSYAGTARLLLAIILLAAAGGLAYAGTLFCHPVRVPSAGRARTVFMLLALVIALGALLACWTAYVRQELHEHIAKAPPANPITMVTLTAAVVLFVIVFIATPRGLGVRLFTGRFSSRLSGRAHHAVAARRVAHGKLSRPAFFCLALMLLVFAVWALAGFGYPSAPIPIA